MRPRALDEFVGQEHFLGPGKLLRRMLDAGRLGSLVFYGPPGTGKTALATSSPGRPVADSSRSTPSRRASRKCAKCSPTPRRSWKSGGNPTILFVDEIHRFNRAQQDVLLPDVEDGRDHADRRDDAESVLRRSTSPLMSRSQIFTFEPLSREHIKTLLQRALLLTRSAAWAS